MRWVTLRWLTLRWLTLRGLGRCDRTHGLANRTKRLTDGAERLTDPVHTEGLRRPGTVLPQRNSRLRAAVGTIGAGGVGRRG